jgi:hypothetical protein
MPVKKATNTIVNREVVDYNMILSSVIKHQQKLSFDLSVARRKIIELEAHIANLTKAA